jgi:A/G-specific adenine glycosylase
MKTAHSLVEDRQRALFRRALLRWFEREKRPLPWRRTRDPYRIWLSEVMLQQTRVAAVADYYARFLRRFPDVNSLARARLSSVLSLWSGLGYYRRARYLHAAARKVVAYGAFPRTVAEWRELPGVGRYTAAAVASIAFGAPCAVVDGNVKRVLRRLLPGTRNHWEQAEALIAPRRPGDFNQAMMELGATVCLPLEPRCSACPVFPWCVTRGADARLPQSARRKRTLTYALSLRDGAVRLVRRRESASLMPGMWELPEVTANGREPLMTLRHSITTTDYTVRVVSEDAGRPVVPGRPNRGSTWVTLARAQRLPLTGLTRKILRAAAKM